MLCVKCQKEIPDGSKFCNWCGAAQIKKQKPAHRRGNGQGTAIKRGKTWTGIAPGKSWVGDDGKLHRERPTKGGFATKSQALLWASQASKKEERAPTLRDYYRTWLQGDYKDLGKSKKVAYDVAWTRVEKVADVPIDDLTINDLQSCVDSQVSTYYPARDMRTLISHLYKMAIAERKTTVNLAEHIRIPDLEETESEPFTENELQKIWDSYGAGNGYLRYVLLMIYTGLMPGEVRELNADMIHTDIREIIGGGIKTKKRKQTPVVYPEILDPVISDVLENQSNDGKLIALTKHQFYDRYYKAIAAAGTRPLSPYSCRHTTGTALALGNIAPSVIQEVMRHTKFSTTQRYIHPDTASAHEAINKLKP